VSILRTIDKARRLGLIVFALVVLGMVPASAAAAPQLGATLTNTPSTLPRTDERIVYTATASNAASPFASVGEVLTCNGTPPTVAWIGAATFNYAWLRNGTPIAGQEAATYTVAAGDANTAIQCMVLGVNENGATAVASPSQPPVVVGSQPTPAIPLPSDPTVAASRPTVSGTGEAKRTCSTASMNWTGATSFGFQWLRNGVAILGATSSEYTPGGGDVAVDLQCEVFPKNASSVSAVSVSNNSLTTGAPSVNQNSTTARPFLGFANTIKGLVTAVLELPSGEETYAFSIKATGWSCSSQLPSGAVPTKITCTRSGALLPGSSYPPIEVVAGIGLDAPEPSGTAVLTVSGGGAPTPATATAEYTFTAGNFFGLYGNSFVAGVFYEGGTAPGTTIAAVSPGSFELSANAAASAPEVFSAGAQPFTVGQPITGVGIPAGTTIAAVSGQSLTLSANATGGVREETITSGAVTGTATVTSGSKAVTEVITAKAKGTTTAGSKVVTGVTVTSGELLTGQTVTTVGDVYTKAGGHPYRAYTSFGLNSHQGANGEIYASGNIRDTVVDAPRGFVGNALTAPTLCKSVEEVILGTCLDSSAVGGIDVYANIGSSLENPYVTKNISSLTARRPIYSLEPEFGRPAQFSFGFVIGNVPYTFVPELRADEGYAIRFRTAPIIMAPSLFGATVNLCGFGAKLSAEKDLGFGLKGKEFLACKVAGEPGANPLPLVTNPTRCSGPPPTTGLKIDSWQHPAEVKTYEYATPPNTECDAVSFEPESVLTPTNHEADSPTGLNVEITMPTDGLLSANGTAQANLDNATVTFPKGMSINAATADGLEACSLAQVKLHSNDEAECPESSKIGTIEIATPIIRKTLTGNIYVAQQNDNPFHSTLGIYLVFASKRDGVTIKVAGKLTPDPQTGQLVSSFVENVEAPFSRISMHFNEGPRAPLVNPAKCGTYAIHSEFSPWSAVNPANPTPEEIVSQDSAYEVSSGPSGSGCPSGALAPKLSSGLKNTQAGSKSPFNLTLTREDGSQRFTGLSVTTPKGLTAYLKGIPYCSDAALAGISEAEETGRSQLANPSCPSASQVGTVEAGAGSGPSPFQAPGKVYLAGPYKGAPVSLAVVTPAVAGPFDLGNVVIRNALYVDPETAQVRTVSDLIPTILHGILLDIRQIRLSLDRANFTAAPTNCEPMSVEATVTGEGGSSASLSNRFQVGGCAALGFKPKLALRLFGGTHRGSHPRLVATLKAREGDANIAGASVALPHSEFLDQAHIGTVCTRVQFKANQCPAASIYGHAEAITPLLDSPLSGPVYLRSSDNPLPDLVVALRGPDSQPIEVVLDSRIDSVNGGIRSSFEAVPDQPVSSFTLKMQGGKKGLLVNSRNLCKSVNKATANFTAQNGRVASSRPVLQNSCKKSRENGAQRAAKHKRHR
jgi:hypothetical protein